VKANVEPWPGRDSTQILPPIHTHQTAPNLISAKPGSSLTTAIVDFEIQKTLNTVQQLAASHSFNKNVEKQQGR
jgi:hypothetical protein